MTRALQAKLEVTRRCRRVVKSMRFVSSSLWKSTFVAFSRWLWLSNFSPFVSCVRVRVRRVRVRVRAVRAWMCFWFCFASLCSWQRIGFMPHCREQLPNLRVWCSSLKRTIQTAQHFEDVEVGLRLVEGQVCLCVFVCVCAMQH